jgi:release factor glutamine methyltransferase
MMKSLVKAARRLAFRIWSLRVRASVNRADACRLFDFDLIIEPGVLHPRHFASSRLLAAWLSRLDLRGRTVADVGTGSGLLALIAARAGASVVAIDISSTAVSCARANAARNRLSGRIAVVQSDVWDAVSEAAPFDLVVTNPPFYARAVESVADHAFASGDRHAFVSRLAAGLSTRLAPGGSLLLIHSSDEEFAPIARLLAEHGLEGVEVVEKRGVFETLTIREFRADPHAAVQQDR